MAVRPASRNPAEILGDVAQRLHEEIVLARFVGKTVVDRSLGEAQRRFGDLRNALGIAGVASNAGAAMDHEADPPAHDDASPADADARVSATGEKVVPPRTEDLALADYDHLPAAHIVAKLAGLDQDERDEIERYELLGRRRRTILGKLDRLRDSGDA